MENGSFGISLFLVTFMFFYLFFFIREFDLTLDHMQNDIDALEKEKQELKQRLTQLSKKTLYESLTGRPGAPSSIAAAVVGETGKDMLHI